MTIEPKYLAILSLIANNPPHRKYMLKSLSGISLKIGKEMVSPSGKGKYYDCAMDIIEWSKNQKL